MGKYAFLGRGSQVSSAVDTLKKSDGLQFKDVFSGEQVSAAIEETVPEYRNRAFPP